MAVAELVRSQALVTSAIQAQLGTAMTGAWQAVAGLDDAAAAAWLDMALPIVQGAQLAMSATTGAQLAATVAEMTGQAPAYTGTPPGLVTGPRIRRGTPPTEVYMRPIVQARSLVASGVDRTTALERGGRRAVTLAQTDVQSAKLYTAQYFMTTTPGVVGFRRTLAGTHSCGLCVVASTRRYRKEHLSPRHPGCDCGVLPIVGDHDPGEVINRDLLESMHANIAERFGPDAVRRAADTGDYAGLVETYDHGEYGPTLVRRGDHTLRSAAASARYHLP